MIPNRHCQRLVSALLCCILLIVLGCTAEAKKERHWKKGEKYLSQSRYRDAVIEFKNVIQIDPNHAGAHLKLGQAHLNAGEFREAHAQFQKCIQLDPNMAEARIQLGRLLLLARKYDDARDQAAAVLARSPENAQAHLLLSMICAAQKDSDCALAEAKKAVAGNPRQTEPHLHLSALYLLRRDLESAKKEIQTAIEIDPKSLPARYALVRIHLAQGEPNLAEDEMVRAVATHPGNASVSVALGDFYMSTSQKEKGLEVYRKLLDQDSKNIPVLSRLAELNLSEGKTAEASANTERILKINPKNAEGQLLKGRIHLMKNEFNEALVYIQPFCRDYPKSASGQYFLGLAHLGNRDLNQAKTHLSEATRLNPRWLEPRLHLADILASSGSYDQALAEIQTVLKQDPLNIRGLLRAGEYSMMKKDYAGAERILSHAIGDAPRNPELHLSRGRALLHQRKEQEALADFEQVLKLRPDYLEALRLITAVHLGARHFSQAADRIETQMKLIPPGPVPYLLLGQVFETAGDVGRSEASYQQAAKIGAAPEFHNALAGFYIRKGLLDKAEKQFLEAVRIAPSSYQAHMGLGIVYEALKNFEKAKEHYRKALSLNPKFTPASNNLAYLYAETNEKIDEALNLAQAAKERAPADPYISDTLGWIYYKKNIHTRAIPYLKEAVEKVPSNPVFHYHLGMAYYKGGRQNESERELKKLLQLQPDFSEKIEVVNVLKDMKKGAGTMTTPQQK